MGFPHIPAMIRITTDINVWVNDWHPPMTDTLMSSLWDPLFLGWVNDFSSLPSSIWPVSPTKAGPLPEARTAAEEQQWPSEPSSPNLASVCMNFWGVTHFIDPNWVWFCERKQHVWFYPSLLSHNWVITIWWIQYYHPIILSFFLWISHFSFRPWAMLLARAPQPRSAPVATWLHQNGRWRDEGPQQLFTDPSQVTTPWQWMPTFVAAVAPSARRWCLTLVQEPVELGFESCTSPWTTLLLEGGVVIH